MLPIPFILFFGACASQQKIDVTDNYYKAKSLFLVVAEESYNYAVQETTSPKDRETIKKIGLEGFEVLAKIDSKIEPTEDVVNQLIRITAQLQEVLYMSKEK